MKTSKIGRRMVWEPKGKFESQNADFLGPKNCLDQIFYMYGLKATRKENKGLIYCKKKYLKWLILSHLLIISTKFINYHF